MKLLFLETHPMWAYGLPNGFRDAGHEVKISGLPAEEYVSGIFSDFKPDLVFTIGWTNDNTEKKASWIHKCAKAARIPLIYWATEDPTHTHSFSLPLIQRMKPDFVFTICPKRVDYYRTMGIKAAHLDFGFHPEINRYTEPEEKYRCSIAVVANGYPTILKLYPQHYRIQSVKTLIAPLVRENVRVDFFGRGWENAGQVIGCGIPQEWIRGYLDYTLASLVYSSSDIVLGIQNHMTQLTQRTYEILASKGFLITSDTPEIRRLFKPGEDLIVSSGPEETLELVAHYMKDANTRRLISEQGQKSVAVHHYVNRAGYIIDVLKESSIL